MVPRRIFQNIRRVRGVLTLVLVSALVPGEGWTQEHSVIDALVIDLRAADETSRKPSSAAFITALGEHDEIRLEGEEELRSILERTSYSAIFEQGRANLAATAVAYGALDCPGVESRSAQTILDLAAAMASGVNARAELHQVYLYRFLCADRQAHSSRAIEAARMLRRISADQDSWRPKEISEATWSRYPQPDTEGEGAVHIGSEPEGATIWIDYKEQGITPLRVLLSHGQHVVALSSKVASVSQQITVSGAGTVHLPLPAQEPQWQSMRESIARLQAATKEDRPEGMRSIMTTIEVQAVFVMREPGRIAVWVWRPQSRRAEHVGHAPNAKIAGNLVLQALGDAQVLGGLGLDPSVALLLQEDETDTRSSSGRRWWVYGVVLGAAAIGAGFIVAQDLSENRQRIEVTLP